MTEKIKIAAEVAETEFDRWADAMDIDHESLAGEDLESFNMQKSKIVKAIVRGSLVISDNDEAVYTPQRSGEVEPITFHERTGASLMAADRVKRDHNVAKMYAILGDMTNQHPSTFAKLKGVDIKVCEALFALLMG